MKNDHRYLDGLCAVTYSDAAYNYAVDCNLLYIATAASRKYASPPQVSYAITPANRLHAYNLRNARQDGCKRCSSQSLHYKTLKH